MPNSATFSVLVTIGLIAMLLIWWIGVRLRRHQPNTLADLLRAHVVH
ncbi:hypothetical protein [Synechococcus sp. UW140]|nr:hypothetical protein [Synechococcus sp. UW140]